MRCDGVCKKRRCLYESEKKPGIIRAAAVLNSAI